MRIEAIVIAVAALAGCSGAAPAPQEEAEERLAMGWSEVFAHQGEGSSQTRSFEIDTSLWRLHWKAEPLPGAECRFVMTAHSTISGRSLAQLVDSMGGGEGIAHLADEPRPFFLRAEADGCRWSVRAEEGMLGTPQKSR